MGPARSESSMMCCEIGAKGLRTVRVYFPNVDIYRLAGGLLSPVDPTPGELEERGGAGAM